MKGILLAIILVAYPIANKESIDKKLSKVKKRVIAQYWLL